MTVLMYPRAMARSAQSRDLPLAGYVRVSRVGARDEDRLRSPDMQREAITRYAAAEGLTVQSFEPELDVSGSKAHRPILDAILDAIDDGELGGLIVAKLDRLSRLSAKERILLFERVEDAGGVILSASEQLDPSTPEGRFARDVFLGVARMQWEKYDQAWTEAKATAHADGIKIGPTPFGYLRTKGRLVIHPSEGPIVAEAFRLAGRYGLTAAVDYLAALEIVHESGKRAGKPRAFTATTVRRLLESRMYLGEMRWGALPPVHDESLTIVSRAAWEAAQPPKTRGRSKARHYPLSGVARCGTCGEEMVGGSAGANIRTYRCRATLKSWRGGRCPAGVNVVADRLEDYVREYLRVEFDGVTFEQTVETANLNAIGERLRDDERELDDFLADTEGAAKLRRVGRYESALDARVSAVEATREEYRLAASEAARGLTKSPADLLSSDDPSDLRELTASTFARITVGKGRGALDGRVSFEPHAPVSAVAAA